MAKILLAVFLFIGIIGAIPQGPPVPPGVLQAAAPVTKALLLTCQNGVLSPSPPAGKALAACKDTAIWGIEEGKKNPECDGLCIAAALGYLGADGKYDQKLYHEFIDNNFGEHKDYAKKHMADCFTNYGDKVDLTDKTCTQVKLFDTCGWKMQPNLKC